MQSNGAIFDRKQGEFQTRVAAIFGAFLGTNRKPARYVDLQFDPRHTPCKTVQVCAIPNTTGPLTKES